MQGVYGEDVGECSCLIRTGVLEASGHPGVMLGGEASRCIMLHGLSSLAPHSTVSSSTSMLHAEHVAALPTCRPTCRGHAHAACCHARVCLRCVRAEAQPGSLPLAPGGGVLAYVTLECIILSILYYSMSYYITLYYIILHYIISYYII